MTCCPIGLEGCHDRRTRRYGTADGAWTGSGWFGVCGSAGVGAPGPGRLPGPELFPARLMRAGAGALPVAGAGLSVFTTDRHRVPLGASDDNAALAERLQFNIGKGPPVGARHRSRLAVHRAGDGAAMADLHNELVQRTPFRSILSMPLDQPGLGGDTTMDLYYENPHLSLPRTNWTMCRMPPTWSRCCW